MSKEKEPKFYDLSEDTIELVQSILNGLALPFNLKIKYMGNSKMKNLISLNKASDIVQHITAYDLFIFINEDYLIKLEEENSKILIHQELDRLEFDIAKGTFKIANFPLQTTIGVLKKYGIEAVAEANQLVELFSQQKADKAEDDENMESKVKSIKKSVEFLD